MATYREYKNGIVGLRYRGYYIIKGDKKGDFQIWTEDKKIYKRNLYDLDECRWILLVDTASPEEYDIIKNLCTKEIYELSDMLVKLIEKKDREGLEKDEQNLYNLVVTVRARKVAMARRK